MGKHSDVYKSTLSNYLKWAEGPAIQSGTVKRPSNFVEADEMAQKLPEMSPEWAWHMQKAMNPLDGETSEIAKKVLKGWNSSGPGSVDPSKTIEERVTPGPTPSISVTPNDLYGSSDPVYAGDPSPQNMVGRSSLMLKDPKTTPGYFVPENQNAISLAPNTKN